MNGKEPSSRTLIIAVVVSALAAFAVTALLINIFQRQEEAKHVFFRVVDLDDHIDDPAIWGKNFPFQYDAYKRTVDCPHTVRRK